MFCRFVRLRALVRFTLLPLHLDKGLRVSADFPIWYPGLQR